MDQITFSIIKKDSIIHGSASKIIFYIERCTLDLFSDIVININGFIEKNNTSIRYILDSNEISPLLLHVDQSVKIH